MDEYQQFGKPAAWHSFLHALPRIARHLIAASGLPREHREWLVQHDTTGCLDPSAIRDSPCGPRTAFMRLPCITGRKPRALVISSRARTAEYVQSGPYVPHGVSVVLRVHHRSRVMCDLAKMQPSKSVPSRHNTSLILLLPVDMSGLPLLLLHT